METYTNDKDEVVVIAEMESRRLIHAIAKYARKYARQEIAGEGESELVKALKNEAIKRLIPTTDEVSHS